MAGDDLLDEAVSDLYSADPDEFTRRRAELVARARSAGQAAVARQIAGLRKPTRSAWMINHLVRSDPDAATRLAALGEELRAAEQSGDSARMRDSAQARRRMIANLVPRALAVSGQHTPPAALREEITATFSAALADPQVAEQIRHGTLLRPARRVGFGTAQAPELALVPPPAGARPGRKPTAGRAAADTARGGSRRDRRRARAGAEQEHRRAAAEAGQAPAGASRGRRRVGKNADRERRHAEAERERRRADAEAERQRRRADAEAERQRRRADAEAERQRRRADAEAERERRRAEAQAERVLADADRAARAARQAEREQEDALRRVEQQVAEARRMLRDARAESRRTETARRKARQALDRLRA